MDDATRFCGQGHGEPHQEDLGSHRNGLRLLYREAFGDVGEFAFIEYVTLLPSMAAFSNNVCLAWVTDRVGGRLTDNARVFDEAVAKHAR